MGTYTQFRGVLCLPSGGQGWTLEEVTAKFNALRETFIADDPRDNLRSLVSGFDTHLHGGSNASIWIFVGSEHKNSGTMMDWIRLLVANFHCEGRIEIQREDMEVGDKQCVLKITPGKIEEVREVAHTYGYGFRP